MKARKPAAMLAVAAILGLTLVVGAAFPANAVSLWPKGFQPRQMMINVLSSVLAAAGGDSPLKRAVIAADQTYDHSWEGLEQQWKLSSSGAPQTYEDYVLQRQEYFAKNNLTSKPGEVSHPNNQKKYVKTAKVPATRAKALVKNGVGLGLGVGAGIGFEYRADIANGAVNLLGVDAAGAVCAMDSDEFGAATGFVNWLSGQDCNAYALSREGWDPNADAGMGYSSEPVCFKNGCVGIGSIAIAKRGSNDVYRICASGAPTSPDGAPYLRVKFQDANGAWKSFSTYLEMDQGSSSRPICGSTDPGVNKFYWEAAFTSAMLVNKDRTLQTLAPICIVPDGVTDNECSAAGVSPVQQTSGNPPRTMVCTVTGDDGKTYTSESEVYTQEDDATATPECPTLPEGVQPEGVKLDEKNGETGQLTPLLDEVATDQYKAWWKAFPECREGACALDLIKKDVNTSCFESITMADACQLWMQDKQKADHYQCMYGTHLVDLSECYAYGDVFYPEKVAAGQGYADPATGKPVAGQSSPKAANRALLRSITDPRDVRGCLDEGWAAANPVEWVLVPVQCALQWGFAPSPDTFTVAGLTMNNAWNKKMPAQVVGAVTGWSFRPVATGCKITAKVMDRDFVMDACEGGALRGLAVLSSTLSIAIFVVIDVLFIRKMTEKAVDA